MGSAKGEVSEGLWFGSPDLAALPTVQVDMSPSDFLHIDADQETELCDHYLAAGAICSLSTNSAQLLAAARDTFLPVEGPPATPDFSIRFWVDQADPAQPPWPKPYVRGLEQLVFAGFDAGSSLVADLRTRRVSGRFSPGMAADIDYWKTVIFPMMLTIVGASVGVAELHCACVAKDLKGLLLAGPSGSGKSTLAVALSQIGFSFLSDDRTFCSLHEGEAAFWGLPTRLKLRPEGALWFEEFRNQRPADAGSWNADFWLDPERSLGLKRLPRCRPHALVFLERQEASGFHLSSVSLSEAMNRLSQGLMAELPDACARRSATLGKVAELPRWLLQYGGAPQTIARNLAEHLERDFARSPVIGNEATRK